MKPGTRLIVALSGSLSICTAAFQSNGEVYQGYILPKNQAAATTMTDSLGHNGYNDLIITDLKKTAIKLNQMEVSTDASYDCWTSALNALEFESVSNEELEFNQNILTPGGNFCQLLKSASQLDVLAFELTKCEYEKFRGPLPDQCTFKEIVSPYTNIDTSIQNCMSSLPNETFNNLFHSFNQYKASSYSICSTLTEELTLHQQKVTAYKLEKIIFEFEGTIDHVLGKAGIQLEEQINRMERSMDLLKDDVKEDLKEAIVSEMKNVKDLKDEMEHMIGRADDKFDEAAKMMDNYLENALTKLYKKSGLKALADYTMKVHYGWLGLKLCTLHIAMVLKIVLVTKYQRIRNARAYMITIVFIACGAELYVNHLDINTDFDSARRDGVILGVQVCHFLIQFIIGTVFLYLSFFKKAEENNQPCNNNELIPKAISDALDIMKIQMNNDREERLQEQEKLNQHILMNIQNHGRQRGEDFLNTPRSFNTPLLNPLPSSFSPSYTSASDYQVAYNPRRDNYAFDDTRQRLEFSSDGGMSGNGSNHTNVVTWIAPATEDVPSQYESCSEVEISSHSSAMTTSQRQENHRHRHRHHQIEEHTREDRVQEGTDRVTNNTSIDQKENLKKRKVLENVNPGNDKNTKKQKK